MENRLFYSSNSLENRDINSKEHISDSKEKNSKIDIKQKKDNAIKSLNEVECFLNDFDRFKRYLHLYKFFKWLKAILLLIISLKIFFKI